MSTGSTRQRAARPRSAISAWAWATTCGSSATMPCSAGCCASSAARQLEPADDAVLDDVGIALHGPVGDQAFLGMLAEPFIAGLAQRPRQTGLTGAQAVVQLVERAGEPGRRVHHREFAQAGRRAAAQRLRQCSLRESLRPGLGEDPGAGERAQQPVERRGLRARGRGERLDAARFVAEGIGDADPRCGGDCAGEDAQPQQPEHLLGRRALLEQGFEHGVHRSSTVAFDVCMNDCMHLLLQSQKADERF
jgi:hypothetical protein